MILKFQNGSSFAKISNDQLRKQYEANLPDPIKNDLRKPLSGYDPFLGPIVKYFTLSKGLGTLGQILNTRRINKAAELYRILRQNDRDIDNYGRNLRRQNIQFADKEVRRLRPFLTGNPFYDVIIDPLFKGYIDIQKNPLLNIILP